MNIYKISVKDYELVDLLLKELFVLHPTHLYYPKYTVKYIIFVGKIINKFRCVKTTLYLEFKTILCVIYGSRIVFKMRLKIVHL